MTETETKKAAGDAVMAELLAPYTPEACEREIEAEQNAKTVLCSKGHATTYSHAIGARRCQYGALVRANGTTIRECQ